jgi:Ca2+:H+ antiporter
MLISDRIGIELTFCRNFTELSFVMIAVVRNEPIVAQTAIAGSLLSHSLLILGTCFTFGGLQNHTQSYPLIIARTTSHMLLISLASLILPTAFKIWSDCEYNLPG